MKTSVIGLCILGFATLSGSVQAQCGCGSSHRAPTVSYRTVAPRPHSAPMSYAAPMTHSASMAPGSISYVNKLDSPVDRGTYSLLYAAHLSDGRLLYTDSVPSGFTVRGTESYRSGSNRSGRKAIVNVGADGSLSVNDPATNQVIAIIQQ